MNNEAYSTNTKKKILFVQEEKQLSIVVPITNIHSLNTSRTATPNSTLCIFCGKYGHTKNICFQKVRFPTIDAKTSKFKSTIKLYAYCNKICHTVDTCYKKYEFPPSYKFNTTNRTTQVHNLVTTDDVSPEQFSKEQNIKDIHLTSQQC